MTAYCEIHEVEFREALALSGLQFTETLLPGCREIVFEAPAALQSDSLHPDTERRCRIRVYSSITSGVSRGVGEDAIRVCVVFRHPSGKEKFFKSARVYRIETWRKNLLARLQAVNEIEAECCPACGGPMVLRKGIYGPFFGCSFYPHCTGKKKA